MIPNYTRVKLATNQYEQEGVALGAIGYIIEVYPDGKYEVEFSDLDGTTTAQLVLSESELVVEPKDPTKG
jgi:hypothetical protein